jgi:hypothetical protein
MVDVFSWIAFGTPANPQSEKNSLEESRKSIFASLLGGKPHYYVDNIHEPLDDPTIAAVTTAEYFGDRLLGQSKQAEVPVRCTWTFAGNNVLLSGELARRSVLIKLDANMADPTVGRTFKHPNLKGWVKEHRGTLVWACLTLIQAWIAAGKPAGKTTLASYDEWSSVMGGILQVAGVEGFLQDREEIKVATGDADGPLSNFVGRWWARFSAAEVALGSLAYNAEPPSKPDAVKDLVSLLLYYKEEIDLGFSNFKLSSWQNQLGQKLSAAKDRVFDVPEGQNTVSVKLRKGRTANGIRYALEQVNSAAFDGPKQPEQDAPDAKPETTTPCLYETVITSLALADWVEAVRASGIVAVDTETTGLDVMTAELVGVSLAIEGRACYVPIAHTTGEAQLSRDEALGALKPVLEDPDITKVLHNAKFDAHIFRAHGIILAGVEDTVLMSYALDSGKASSYGLKELAQEHLGHRQTRFEDVVGKRRTFAEVSISAATAYAAQDADVTLRLYRQLKPRLDCEGVAGTYELDRGLQPVIMDMERAGVSLVPL